MTRSTLRLCTSLFIALPMGGCKSAPATESPPPSASAAAVTSAEPAAQPAQAEQPAPAAQPQPAQAEAAASQPIAPPTPAGLLEPGADRTAPEQFSARLETTKGEIIIDVTRAWAPRGADRFYTLVKLGYFDDTAFFRVVQGFMAQIGIHGDPRVNEVWRSRRIPDDAAQQSNTRGMVSFATSGPDSRVNQFFINLVDNSRLDAMGFAPFGKVREMAAADALHAGYGEGAPAGMGPMQVRIQREGNTYLRAEFPQLDYIVKARID